MNFWKQSNHVMSYFKEENFRGDHRLPSNFMSGFLEVRCSLYYPSMRVTFADLRPGSQLKMGYQERIPCRYQIEFPEPPSETFFLMCHIYLHAINADPCSFSETSPKVGGTMRPQGEIETSQTAVARRWAAIASWMGLGSEEQTLWRPRTFRRQHRTCLGGP